MKYHTPLSIILTLAATALSAYGQAGAVYTNFIRQVQLPTNVVWDLSVLPIGEQQSALAIDPGGARFELWSVRDNPFTIFLLDTKYVGTYVPMASVSILTEDPNMYNAIPRTRADRPFIVDVTTSGLRSEEDAPAASKSVKLVRHVQSYAAGSDGSNVDREQAILLRQVTLTNNAVHRLSYAINSVPGADRAKVRGEERFTVFSVADYQAPESRISSMYVQVWPVADGSIAGITPNQVIRFDMPTLTFTLNDLYPDSQTYAQVYKGGLQDGVEGTVIPGAGRNIFQGAPVSEVNVVTDWDQTVPEDGLWTMELLTVTPFGTDRLAHVSFNVDRALRVNGSITTLK
jgi:hypothetical protein